MAAAKYDPATTGVYVKPGKYYEKYFSEDYDENLFSEDYNGNLFRRGVNPGIEGEVRTMKRLLKLRTHRLPPSDKGNEI